MNPHAALEEVKISSVEIVPINTLALVDLMMVYHRVDESERSKFIGKMKHFQRHGFPAGNQVGRGHAARYQIDQVLQMMLALELYDMGNGMPPSIAAAVVNASWGRIAGEVLSDLCEAFAGHPPHDLAWEVPKHGHVSVGWEAITSLELVAVDRHDIAESLIRSPAGRQQHYLMRGAMAEAMMRSLGKADVSIFLS